ncbi:ATP-grasp domain-containing protein [Clostridiaceae bacterium HSG29]|nr:ATP-grasp domain-containing protein [Clostridiaceae bacterium HSG29]
MKKILVLGAGSCQINLINRIKEMGHYVIASGYNINAPGKKIANEALLADTFSYEENLENAKEYNVDAIVTSGTDQPVLTVSKVAKKLELISFLDELTAFNVTNKKMMKKIFAENNIKAVNYKIIKKDFKIDDLSDLNEPIVIKPLDSQGQRGIFKLKSKKEIINYIDKTLKYSRTEEVLIEEFYENKELTVTGWVDNGNVKILTVTDRVTFESELNIGICKSHEYPSIHLEKYRKEIFDITKKICDAFKIKEGPIYFQYLVGDEGILVNEIACRIGGAYEDISIPYVTGVDILKMLIEGSLNENYNKEILRNYKYDDTKMCLSTQLFFCKKGKIKHMTKKEDLLKKDYILDIGYNYKIGDTVIEKENASQRAGYVIIKGKNEEEIEKNIEKTFDIMKFENEKSENMIIRGKRWYR